MNMHNSAKNISNDYIMEEEIKYLRNINAILEIAVISIDKKVEEIGYLEEDLDSDNLPFEEETIEIEYMDLNSWIDIKVMNDSCIIESVTVKDQNDIDYNYISKWLEQDLNKYYTTSSIQRGFLYNQSKEIAHDQNDHYNLSPLMPIGYDINPIHIENIKSLCDENEKSISLFLKHGYAGRKLKLKRQTKTTHIVKTILKIVNSNTFQQVNNLSDKQNIAGFIFDNFILHNGGSLNLGTIKNNISKHYFAS